MDISLDRLELVDVVDDAAFGMVPPCADPGFDHRSCDYWEDADRGSRAARLDWLTAGGTAPTEPARPAAAANPFLADLAANRPNSAPNPFLSGDDDPLGNNPFAPRPVREATIAESAPRKLRLLGRGVGITGSYAKVLRLDGVSVAYCQFGPLTAYPRAQRTRDLYLALPDSPLPAVITCIATTAAARGQGLGQVLVRAVCDDLGRRGFAAVETYPEVGSDANATSGATPAFWIDAGFHVAAADERFPVLRRELE